MLGYELGCDRRSQLSSARGGNVRLRNIEVRMVKHVRGRRGEGHSHPLSHVELPGQVEVSYVDPRPLENIHTAVAEAARCRHSEARRVKPLGYGALARRQVAVTHAIGQPAGRIRAGWIRTGKGRRKIRV